MQRELWHGMKRAGDVLDRDDVDIGDMLRAVNALAVVTNAYLRALEQGDLRDQVAELWAAHQAEQGRGKLR